MPEKYWYLKSCELFEQLTAQQAARLESRARIKTFEKGNLIYLPSDNSQSVLLLASGRVKIYHLTPEGKQALLALMEPGELFGELAIFEDVSQREEFAETMVKSTVIVIPGDAIRELMEEHPKLSMGVSKLMGLRRQRVERRLKSLLFRSNRERLVHLLMDLAEKYGEVTPEGVKIGIKLSHQDLSSIIGSTRETVTVALGELQQEGSLRISRRQLILTRINQLAESIDLPVPDVPNSSPPHSASRHPRVKPDFT